MIESLDAGDSADLFPGAEEPPAGSEHGKSASGAARIEGRGVAAASARIAAAETHSATGTSAAIAKQLAARRYGARCTSRQAHEH